MNRIALFDFDGTITIKDTFIEFALFTRGKGEFIKAILRNIHKLVAWKLGIISNSQAKEALFCTLYKGWSYVTFNEKCREFNERIREILNPDTVDVLLQFTHQDFTIGIVTASIENWVLPWSEQNKVNFVLGTKVEIDENGILTGKFSTPNCHGPEKVNRIRKRIPNLSEYEIWAYGDSSGDREMLEIADHKHWVQ